MKRIIYYRMIMIGLISAFLTVLFTNIIYYQKFQTQIIEDLRSHTHLLMSTENYLDTIEKNYDPKTDNLRITVIEADGTVQYDSDADSETMENHKDRPEIQAAFSAGEGSDIRESDTLDKRTYYYAERLNNGEVIRVAREAGSIWDLFRGVLPLLGFMLLVMFIISFAMARVSARQMIRPVELLSMHLDSEQTPEGTYDEIKPFLDKIHVQHRELKDNARMRQEFTANVSHELKTPLTAISGYAELIETGIAGEKESRHFAGEIHKNANRLLTLIDDILHLSKLDVMESTPDLETVNLCELAVDAVDLLQLHAGKYQVTLQYAKKEKSVFVKGNKEMLQELIYNLCDNAIRYNHPGGYVRISVYREKGKSVLEVTDNGIGISKEDQERIFERFYRVDKSRSKASGGTGLGLAIVKHIVEQHGAELELVSELSEGTAIRILFSDK